MNVSYRALSIATLVAATVTTASAAPPTEHLRGTIVSSTATTLTMKTDSGPIVVHLGPKAAVAGAVAGSPADVVPGKFVGIASVPGGGSVNRALEVVVFDDAMRGAGEGDYGWDLQSPQGHSAMTNGTITPSTQHSTMTNATVGSTTGSGAKTITMAYKGGSRKLVIPANAPVVRVSPGSKALLTAGASVFVIATKSKTPDAAFVIVGQNGVKLPM